MGVKDLWQLLSPIGRRVSIETLEGKTLAIDASIWITQFLKAMRDDDGKMIKNAHLIGTLRRVLKLLFHKIRPVFVFDGMTPALKYNTVKARRHNTEKNEVNKKIAAQRLFRAQLKQHVLTTMKRAAEADNQSTGAHQQQQQHFQHVQERVQVQQQPSYKDQALCRDPYLKHSVLNIGHSAFVQVSAPNLPAEQPAQQPAEQDLPPSLFVAFYLLTTAKPFSCSSRPRLGFSHKIRVGTIVSFTADQQRRNTSVAPLLLSGTRTVTSTPRS